MDKQYVDYDSLGEILNTYVSARLRDRILHEVKKMDIRTAAQKLSIHEKRRLLDSDDEVCALQVWQRADIIAALKAKNAPCDTDTVDTIMREVRSSLEDCSDGWEKIDTVIRQCL